MRGVAYQWNVEGKSWKLPLLARVARGAFSVKPSTPYGTGTVHDFMHAKVTVVDDTVFVGSFNLSRSGERNAENVLEVNDAALADRMAAFVDAIRSRYPRSTVPARQSGQSRAASRSADSAPASPIATSTCRITHSR